MNFDNYAYLGADNNPTGFTNNWLESRSHSHFYDQVYSDYKLFEEDPRGPGGQSGSSGGSSGGSYRDIVRTMIETNPVSDMFFSNNNVQHLKKIICRSIYQQSGGKYNPAPEAQSDGDLIQVMRGIYLDNAKHLPDGIREQVAELNYLVLLDMVPRALSNAQYQLSYIRDTTHRPLHMDRPLHVSSAGTRTNRSITSTFI